MALATARDSAGEVPRPPIRIRTLLLFALLATGAWWAAPRARAAWQLPAVSSALGDYALCMIGPTGPSLLRDNPEEFERVVRRRLVASAADERPFYACADAAREISQSVEVERAHLATAWSFSEYGGSPARTAKLGVADLHVTTRRLAELSEAAWPFVSGGFTKLVRPSASARQAPFTGELPRAALGSGLPAWRSHYRAVRGAGDRYLLAVGSAANLAVYQTLDRGLHWAPVSARHSGVGDFAERCPAGGSRSYTFGLTEDATQWTVTSLDSDAPPTTTQAASAELKLFASACDARGLVAAWISEDSHAVVARYCAFRSACIELVLPEFTGTGVRPGYPLDLARVDGVTVVAVAMGGIVRVASSRDDGQNFSPYSVAYDAADAGSAVVPDRLLVVGSRLILHGTSPDPRGGYPVLVSDNAGASWRTP
jgi:hypothetical protein